MKKHTKKLIVAVLTVVMCLTSVPCFASETVDGISPRLSHMGSAAFSFAAYESGGEAVISYEGYYASFVQAKATIKVEKRFLLVFWNDVDEWTATSTDVWGEFIHVFPLDGKGTYRATMTLEVTGTDGTVDVITDTIESTY